MLSDQVKIIINIETMENVKETIESHLKTLKEDRQEILPKDKLINWDNRSKRIN